MPDLTPCDLVLKGSAALAASAVLFAYGPAQAQDVPFGCPKADAVPYFESIVLEAGFTPDPFTEANYYLLGGTKLDDCGIEATGFGDQRPAYVLTWEGDVPQLVVSMESDADTLLLIHDPAGEWHFNDNGDGQNPAVVIENPTAGSYVIFVGTADPVLRDFQSELRISQAGP